MKVILFIILIPALSGCYSEHQDVMTGLEGKPLPYFNILLMDSTTSFNTSSITYDEPVVLFYFSPHCPYCRVQTKDIIENIKTLYPIRFYFISNFPFPLIKEYYDKYNLKNHSNIIVGHDYTVAFSHHYNATAIPYLAFFGRDKNLKKVIIGNIKPEAIKDIALN